MAVYIAHPATSAPYQVTAAVVNVNRQNPFGPPFEEGTLRIRLCRAMGANQPPLDTLLAPEWMITPQAVTRQNKGFLELTLAVPLALPDSVCFWWQLGTTGATPRTRRSIRTGAGPARELGTYHVLYLD